MCESTVIIKNTNGDRIMAFNILNNKYIAFTIFHSSLIVVEINENELILLCNKYCYNRNYLDIEFDKLIIEATKSEDPDNFISKMDTYINLYDISIHNETTEEIINTCKIILEDG